MRTIHELTGMIVAVLSIASFLPIAAFVPRTYTVRQERLPSWLLLQRSMTKTEFELWLDGRTKKEDVHQASSGSTQRIVSFWENQRKVVDRVLIDEDSETFGDQDALVIRFILKDRSLQEINSKGEWHSLGRSLPIHDFQDQENAMEYMKSCKIPDGSWIHVECADWTMIPLENLIAEARRRGFLLSAAVHRIEQIQGISYALFYGVNALLLPPDKAMWEVATKIKIDRLGLPSVIKEEKANDCADERSSRLSFVKVNVSSVEDGGLGDRVCLDLIQLLDVGEGALIGSSAKFLFAVHGETLKSEFVPSRPFRINAGPVHSYVMMHDFTLKYLCEVRAGDAILVVKYDGSTRSVAVGRCKIEPRPFVLVRARTADDVEGQIFLQQAETCRLMNCAEANSIDVTKIHTGDALSIFLRTKGTHVGKAIDAKVIEL